MPNRMLNCGKIEIKKYTLNIIIADYMPNRVLNCGKTEIKKYTLIVVTAKDIPYPYRRTTTK